jgi:hypothetical protein
MRTLTIVGAVLLVLGPLGSSAARAADDSKMNQGTKQVESGGKQIGQGVVDTAKGVGNTVVGGAEVAGDKFKEAGEAAKPKATNAWESVRDGTVSFGRSVKTFFTTLFDKSPKRNELRTETGSSSSTQ